MEELIVNRALVSKRACCLRCKADSFFVEVHQALDYIQDHAGRTIGVRIEHQGEESWCENLPACGYHIDRRRPVYPIVEHIYPSPGNRAGQLAEVKVDQGGAQDSLLE